MADISQIKLPNGDTYDVKDTSKSSATNWVNGSATGSVRTVGSAAEDSNYTMGTYAVAEGSNTKASGDYGSHAEGASTVASANGAHAEGLSTTSSNYGSHAEGVSTTASGRYSHAEGCQTTATGEAAHAEGTTTKAYSNYSHAEGLNTEAYGRSQHVFGENNIVDSAQSSTNRATYVEIVGNGTDSSNLHNARTLDWSGNEWLAGKLTVGTAGVNSMDVATVGQLPTTTSQLTNDSGFITSYTETDPVFSASAAAGITSGDISNWNAKVSDDHKWNDVSLTKSATSITSDVYVPCMLSTSATSAELLSVLDGATTAYSLVRRNGSGYIKAATPPANDNSTYVATTAWVKSALPTKTSDLTNDSGYITSASLPDLSNYVQNHYSDSVNSYILPWTSEGAGYIQYRVSYSDNTESSTNIAYGVDTQRNSWIGLGADSLHFVGNIKLQTENDPNNSIYLTIPILSSDVTLTLPNTTGTLALTSNIPTKTSDLTNDNGFVTTDEKVKTINAGNNTNYYLVMGSLTGTETKMASMGLCYKANSSDHISTLTIGYPMASGHLTGNIVLAKDNNYHTTIVPSTTGTHNTLTLPNSTGTLALTSDIPPIPLIPTDLSDLNNDLNVSDFPNDAGYITGYTETDPIFTASAAHGISTSDITNWNSKQAALVSGTNIKTINNTSLLGSGNISIQSEPEIFIAEYNVTTSTEIETAYQAEKAIFVTYSVTENNITYYYIAPFTQKTGNIYTFVCNQGDIMTALICINDVWTMSNLSLQTELVSGTNIKTINNTSILGSGNISIVASGTSIPTADTVAEFDNDAHMNSTDMTSQEVEDFVDGLNVTASTLVDYIVEQGTDNGWTYRKWNSGIFEAWRTYNATDLDMTSASSGTYYGATKTIALPSFTLTLSCSTYSETPSHSSGVYIYQTQMVSGGNLSIDYRCFYSQSDSTCNGYFHVIGTWK